MRWLRRHSSKTIAVKVSTLESDLEFSIPVKSTGKDLFDLVCGTFGLRETWYFGLQSYVLVNDGSVKYLNWLKPDKILSQHPLPLPFQFCYFFHAKFYPEDVEHELIQPITKHLFYLEVKDKIENRGRLSHLGDATFIQPSLEAAIQLTVLSAQIEFEDFGEGETDDETEQLVLSKRLLRLLPKYLSVNIQVNTGVAQRLKECYMSNKGLDREEAELRYLKIAQSYRLFGVDYFVVTCVRMKDPRTLSLTRYFSRAEFSHWRTLDRNQELSWVGITAAGIQLFTKDHVDRARYTFPWNIIKNVSYRERKFTVKLNMAWRPTKKSAGLTFSGCRPSSTQAQQQSGHSPAGGTGAMTLSAPHTPLAARGSPSLPGTPVSGKRGPMRPPLPPPPQPPVTFALSPTTSVSSKYLSTTAHLSRGQLVRARSKERPLPSPADPQEPVIQARESTTTYGGGSSGIHPHRSTVSASPASDFASGGGGIFGGSGVSSAGSVASGPPPVSRHGATIIEMWLAEPYQAKNIIHLCAGNHSLFMRRRQPDSIDVQQMKAHEREERLRRETERARLLRERSEKTAALKLNAALESRCAELESALRSSTAIAAAAAAAGSPSLPSPVEALISSRRVLKRTAMPKDGDGEGRGEEGEEEREVEEEGDGENIDEKEGELQRQSGVQFSSRESQERLSSPPAYAHLQHQRRQRHGGAEGRRSKGETIKGIDLPSDPVRLAQASPHAVPSGIYEGFVMAHSAAVASIPTQSEPAIPQTLAWSPTVIHQAREDLTSLTYSQSPFLPPRPVLVTQSLEHLPSQQIAPNLSQRSRVPAPLVSYPITSTLSLHSGYGAVNPLQKTGPNVAPSLASNYYMQQRLTHQGQSSHPWPNTHIAALGSTHSARLFNGFSYPGHLNLAGDESARQGIATTGVAMTSPSPALAQASCLAFGLSGGPTISISPAESVPLVGQSASRRPPFSHLHQPAMCIGGFPPSAYSNPYANYPYVPSNSGAPICYCPPWGYRGFNSAAYYDANAAQPCFSQSVPCAPVSMPILNAGDELYMTGGGETEELPCLSGYYQPPWYPYYDPYWHWLRAATGVVASCTASSTGVEPRTVGWSPNAVPPPPPPPLPLPTLANVPLSAMLSPYAGPTRRRIQQQKLAATRQLQRQQRFQQHLDCQEGAGLPSGRQVIRGVSLQDLPSRTRSGSESGFGVDHTREYSASRPSLVQMVAATSSATFQPSDNHGGGSSGSYGGDGDTRLEDQQPPGIFTSPPPPNLLTNPTSSSEEQIRLAYQHQLHRRMWEEWMWRASTAYPSQRVPGEVTERPEHQHLSAYPSPGSGTGASVSGGDGSGAPFRRMPPPPPPSYSQYVASGISPQSGQQHLTPIGAVTDIRDPSGPDGSSSVGYMGLDFHGVTGAAALSSGALAEVPPLPTLDEPFHHQEHLPSSFSSLQRGQHPGSVDRLSTMVRLSRSSVLGHKTNSHLYANMTLVDGKLVPLMGRPAPILPHQPMRAPVTFSETRAVGATGAVSSRGASSATTTTAVSVVPTSSRQSRPHTRYHSSQTVWLTGTICDVEASRQPSESASPQFPPSKVEIPKGVGFWEPQ
uniref:Merlin:moesin:ezrin:radixin n=1 Tax=Echinococcus granulosus TaxID=6210 RepID=A0A068WG27_ECHGR|nr:merlin:moesin:ezrin:radixin [Echinococcus granulosus]